MATEDRMKTLYCHKSMGGAPSHCLGSQCTAFRAADVTVQIEDPPGVLIGRIVSGAGSYCADLKHDQWDVPMVGA